MKELHPGEAGLFQNALLAAIYAVLTLCLAPLSYGPIQVRISESLTLLAFYDKGGYPASPWAASCPISAAPSGSPTW